MKLIVLALFLILATTMSANAAKRKPLELLLKKCKITSSLKLGTYDSEVFAPMLEMKSELDALTKLPGTPRFARISKMDPSRVFLLGKYVNLLLGFIRFPDTSHPEIQVSAESQTVLRSTRTQINRFLRLRIGAEDRLKILTAPDLFADVFDIPAEKFLYNDKTNRGFARGWVGLWRNGIDEMLDNVNTLDFEATEARLHEEERVASRRGDADWTNNELPRRDLLTSYFDFDAILRNLKIGRGKRIGDMGCAYARAGFYIGAQRPDLSFVGVDISEPRVLAAQSGIKTLNYENVEVQLLDLAHEQFQIPDVDYLFLYDPVNDSTRGPLFEKIREKAKQRGKPIYVICRAGRDEFFEFLDKLNGSVSWFKLIQQIPSRDDWYRSSRVYRVDP